MTKEEILTLIASKIEGQGNQIDTANAIPLILRGIVELLGEGESRIGDLADLDTDHKATIVDAVNEVADALETEELVVSAMQTNAERKIIYDLCASHLQLAKNIVFWQPIDQMYYKVNGYNMVNGALKLHVVLGSTQTTVTIAPNGSLLVS